MNIIINIKIKNNNKKNENLKARINNFLKG